MKRPLISLCAIALLAAVAAPVRAAREGGFVLPPLNQPASGQTHPGKVIWVDLVTPDLKQAKLFYGGLFGWTFTSVPHDPHFAIAELDGRPVAGVLQRAMPAAEKRQPTWLAFIAVQDVDAASRSASANGGTVLSAPKNYPQRGRQAVLQDPDGAVFAVMASSSGDPPDELADPGEWIWSSLLANDPDKEAAFYRTLFGYEVFDLAADDHGSADVGSKHLILSSDDYARAGIHSLASGSMRRHPHWLNFVRVEDVAASVAKAVQLGGRVLVAPRPDRHGGQLAVVADSAGAPIGLMEWAAGEAPGMDRSATPIDQTERP